MFWVEFIGASGVGKSYLYKKLKETRTSADDWLTPDEGLKIIINKENLLRQHRLRKRIYYAIKKLLIRKNNDFEIIPTSYIKKAFDTHGWKFNFLSEIKIRNYAETSYLEPRKKLSNISWYYQKRLLPFIVLYAANINKTFLFEDGILHTNLGISNLDEYLNTIDSKEQVIYPNAIVHAKANPEVIFERVKKRNKTKQGTIAQRDLSDIQIREDIRNRMEKDVSTFKNMSKKVSRILEIDTTDSLVKNCKYINSFINVLNSSKVSELD